MAKYGQQVDKPKPRNDVYTGLLAVSLVGMLIGCGLLYLDYRQYEDVRPPKNLNLPPLPQGGAKTAEAPPPKGDAGKKEDVAPKKDEKKDEMKKDEKKDDAK
jgi:hypothetical protein